MRKNIVSSRVQYHAGDQTNIFPVDGSRRSESSHDSTPISDYCRRERYSVLTGQNVVDIAVDDERWRPGPDVLWDANAAHQLLHPKYHALVEDDFQTDATTKNDDDELMSLIALRSLFIDAEIWNNLMTWNHDLIAWPWLRIFNILHQVFPD